jgi:hypothetical protein
VGAIATAAGSRCRGAQTLDRVVASAGDVAITASDVTNECRFESFLNAQWPPPAPDSEALAGARERLADQILLTREENPGTGERKVSETVASARLATLRMEFVPPQKFHQALAELGMTEAEVVARITQDMLVLRLIDERLRPGAFPSDNAIAEYYDLTIVKEFHRQNGNAAVPPLSEVDDQIREVLIQKRINELLNQWIAELKLTFRLRIHSF